MAAPDNTFTSFDAVGNREDLTDMIYDISPTETPFSSRAKRTTCKATFHEWQTDSLADVDTDNAHIQGDDADFDAVIPTVRLGNRTQIVRKTCVIAGTQEAVDKAGRKSEVAFNTMKKGKELKRDLEAIFLSNQAADAGEATEATRMGTLLAFLHTNTDFATDGADPDYEDVPDDTRTDGTPRVFLETQLAEVVQSCWDNGADPSIIMLGGAMKRRFSAFEGLAERRWQASGKRPGQAVVMGGADVYAGDFGTLTTVPNRFMRSRDVLILDMQYVEVPYLRPITPIPLAKTGDSIKWMILGELTLKVKSEVALGGIFDLHANPS